MYCSRILRYEYTRPIRMLQFSRARGVSPVFPLLQKLHSQTFARIRIPLLTTYANTLNRLLRPQNLLLRCIQRILVLFSVIYFAFSKGERDDWKSKSKWKKLAPDEIGERRGGGKGAAREEKVYFLSERAKRQSHGLNKGPFILSDNLSSI